MTAHKRICPLCYHPASATTEGNAILMLASHITKYHGLIETSKFLKANFNQEISTRIIEAITNEIRD